jgi:hypothetical protein
MSDEGARNLRMAQRIEAAEVSYPLRFVVAGDSGAWPDPTAEGIFSHLVAQIARRRPQPLFFANLGDFAGPGTLERHQRYLELVAPLPMPDLCVVGNHDLDAPGADEVFARVHGPMSFSFAHGHTRFVVMHAQPGVTGEVDVPGVGTPEGCQGPREQDLVFLAQTLASATEPNRVVLMHMPPHLDGRYAPHADWGFKRLEREFLDILQQHGVRLVCCAHGLAFDDCERDGVRFVMSGGGGSGLCSHLRGICTAGPGRPEDRGALFHAVEVAISAGGEIDIAVMQAFARDDAPESRRRQILDR